MFRSNEDQTGGIELTDLPLHPQIEEERADPTQPAIDATSPPARNISAPQVGCTDGCCVFVDKLATMGPPRALLHGPCGDVAYALDVGVRPSLSKRSLQICTAPTANFGHPRLTGC
jgi:hypothetical protein